MVYRIFLGSRKPTLIVVLLLSFLLPPSQSEAAETAILSITLNSEPKGELFVNLTDDGDFLIKEEDLKGMGFREFIGRVVDISGERYISLRSMRGVEFVFNEKEVSLEITASPDLLPKMAIDFISKRPADVYYPKDNSAFLNYGLNYSKSAPSDIESFNVNNQLGIRAGDFLLLSDSAYTKSEGDEDLVRLLSNITYDRREDMQRTIIGDNFASSGDLGSSINIGGISYSKVYTINPYFIKYPTLELSGLISLPSEVEVYLNGILLRREKLSPGEFDLKNISYYGGAGLVEIVIIDPFGRRQRVSHPFYLTDLLLKKGLHEYSYNIGFIREEFGVESNQYTDPAFSAFHRYGISDNLTIGLRGEGTNGLYNFGPQLSYNSNNAGIFTISLSNSINDREGTGFAGSLSHSYYGRSINARLLLRGFTRDYLTITTDPASEKTRYEAAAGIGHSDKDIGSISLDYTTTESYEDSRKQEVAATYSRNLSDNLSAFVTVKNTAISNQETANEFFVGINYYMGGNTTLSSNYQRGDDADVEMVQVQKNPPIGEGLGYRVSLQRTGSEETSYRLNPDLRYNSRYGIYEGEYRGDYSETGDVGEFYQVSASGGIAYIGKTMGFSRPFYDSFGLVKVGEVEGVRVYHNNQEIGRTDSTGKIFVPTMASYYDNQISINDKDIPLNYYISKVSEYVSPPLRSGSCVIFDVTNVQAIAGTLKMKEDGAVKPVEFHDVTIKVGDKDILFPTGRGGEFYFENVLPEEIRDSYGHKGCSYLTEETKLPVIKSGTYKASFEYAGRTCSFNVVIPESDEMIINLGEVLCNIAPPSLIQPAIEGPK